MGDLNAWKFIETDLVQGASDKAKKQVNELLQMKSDQYLHTSRDNIKLLHFGAISCGESEGIWLVQWTAHPFQLQVPTQVEGSPQPLPVGTWVCKGTFYNRIDMAKGWYEKPRNAQPLLFSISQVLRADVEVERYHPRDNAPPPAANRYYDRPNARAFLRYVPFNIRNLMLRDGRRMAKLGLYYMDGEIPEEDDPEPEEEEEQEEPPEEDEEEGIDEDLEEAVEEEDDEDLEEELEEEDEALDEESEEEDE